MSNHFVFENWDCQMWRLGSGRPFWINALIFGSRTHVPMCNPYYRNELEAYLLDNLWLKLPCIWKHPRLSYVEFASERTQGYRARNEAALHEQMVTKSIGPWRFL